jgi:hypothetical protein
MAMPVAMMPVVMMQCSDRRATDRTYGRALPDGYAREHGARHSTASRAYGRAPDDATGASDGGRAGQCLRAAATVMTDFLIALSSGSIFLAW